MLQLLCGSWLNCWYRANLHVPAGELWELKAVAAVLGLDPSRLLRHLWETFRTTMEAKQALQRVLEAGGTPTETTTEAAADG